MADEIQLGSLPWLKQTQCRPVSLFGLPSLTASVCGYLLISMIAQQESLGFVFPGMFVWVCMGALVSPVIKTMHVEVILGQRPGEAAEAAHCS